MAMIQVLEKHVAELIAAGEVVERPASVIKELCENSIDAGATAVTVEIKRGGVAYLRVTDNGSGIPRDQVGKAFLRHATSKVHTADDLADILTLGFRGEALASMAAMCRVEMLTCTAEETVGTYYTIEGGEETGCEDAGCPVGTTIVARDIFYNTPARMKFLKRDVTEGNAVASVVDKLALSHPEVAFKLLRDGEQKLQTPGDGQLLSAIYAVYGREFASGMLPVEYKAPNGLRLTGYISKPECAKATRTQQSFYINTRYIRSRTCAAALEEAYRHSIMVGKHPYCVLNLSIPAGVVDVNVHPAKTEVRFADEKAIFDLVYYGCKTVLSGLGNVTAGGLSKKRETVNALTIKNQPVEGTQQHFTSQQYNRMVAGQEQNPAPHIPAPTPVVQPQQTSEKLQYFTVNDSAAAVVRDESVPQLGRPAPLDQDLWRPAPRPQHQPPPKWAEPPAAAETPTPPTAPGSVATLDFPVLRQVGELFDTYILLEGDDGLILVDKHAAHERLQFERIKAAASHSDRQLLLAPVTVVLEKELYSAAVQNFDTYEQLGFLAEDFGVGTLLIREAPIELAKGDIAALTEEIAEKLAGNSREMTPHMLDDLYHSIACKSAIKAGNKTTPAELAELVRLVAENPEIRNCPHGRPVAVSVSLREIEKMFGRV